MQMHHPSRFAFDRVFSSTEPSAKVSSIDYELELQALRTEIEAMRAERKAVLSAARAEGFEAGLAQARGERDAALLSAVDALHGAVEALDERFGETEARLTQQAAEVAVTAAEFIAGRTLAAEPAHLVDEAVGRVLGQVARGTEISIRVHPDLVAAMEARVEARQANDRRRLNLAVYGDASLAMGDAMIAWDQGGLALDAAARREAVKIELESLLPAQD